MVEDFKQRVRVKSQKKRVYNINSVLRIFMWISLVISSCLVLFCAIAYITSSQLFHVKNIAIRGCSQVQEDEILSMLDIEEGDNIISCDIDAARQRLLENTWIKDVSIARRFFPAALTVNLREYNPMAAIFIDGKGYVINEEGRIFASMPKGYKGMIMQTEGFVPTGEKMNEIIKKGVSAIRAMRSKGLTVDGMVIQPSGRTTYNLKNGVSIAAIGSLTPAKLDAAMAVIKQIKPAKGSILDLSYEDKIVLSAPPNNKGGLVTRGG